MGKNILNFHFDYLPPSLNRDKKMFKRAMEKLVRQDANIQKTLLIEIKKLYHKGQGKAGAAFHEIPPTDFSLTSQINSRTDCKSDGR